MPLPDLEGWAIFSRIAATGSFAAAASELGLSTATVSKAIKRLEARLGERLLHRTSRRLSLTETGRLLTARAARMLEEAEAVEAHAQAKSTAPRGRLRLAAPLSFGLRHVAPILPAFLTRYPEIAVDLQLEDRTVDLVAAGIDIALRIGELPDSSLIARRLCGVRSRLLAAPSYLARHGMPGRPGELKDHACLSYAYRTGGDHWRFYDQSGHEEAVSIKGRLTATNGDAIGFALEAGLGLGVLPDFLVWERIAQGRLVPVMPDWSLQPRALHLIMQPGSPRPSRINVLADFLVHHFAVSPVPWATEAA